MGQVIWYPLTCECVLIQDCIAEQDPVYVGYRKKCAIHENVADEDLDAVVHQHNFDNSPEPPPPV